MADTAQSTTFTPPPRRFGLRDLSRLGTWGLVALGALTLTAYAASSDIGKDRLILVVANLRGVPPPERLARTPADTRARQVAETLRELATDREQLVARLDKLERNVGDMTGSIARIATAPTPSVTWPIPAIAPPEAQPAAAPPESVVAPAPPTPATDVPLPRAAAPQTAVDDAVKPEFGVDVGRSNSVEGLRQLWNALKGRHGAALEGLRPVMTIREVARSGGVEIRLVAGPIPNATAAARLCASLPGVPCHPTVFDGQRLALR